LLGIAPACTQKLQQARLRPRPTVIARPLKAAEAISLQARPHPPATSQNDLVDGGLPSPTTKDSRAKGKFWGAAKFAFRPMTQNIYGEPAEPSKMPQWVDFGKI